MRIIIGVKGNKIQAFPHRRIERITSYGRELDFFDLKEGTIIDTLDDELFRVYPEEYHKENALKTFGLNQFEEMVKLERFWELHEVLEHYWSQAESINKKILKALIGIMVSQVKWQMSQYNTSERILNRTICELEQLTGMKKENILKVSSYPVVLSENFMSSVTQIYIK